MNCYCKSCRLWRAMPGRSAVLWASELGYQVIPRRAKFRWWVS